MSNSQDGNEINTVAPCTPTQTQPTDVQMKICKICHGKASGHHFGVMSCEGCKGFFRRNVKKNARFICNYDKKCDITGEQKRKNCQACRMARCEEAGMRKDRIMMHERRKNRRTDGKKERILPLPETEPKVKVEAEEMEPAREPTLRKRKRSVEIKKEIQEDFASGDPLRRSNGSSSLAPSSVAPSPPGLVAGSVPSPVGQSSVAQLPSRPPTQQVVLSDPVSPFPGCGTSVQLDQIAHPAYQSAFYQQCVGGHLTPSQTPSGASWASSSSVPSCLPPVVQQHLQHSQPQLAQQRIFLSRQKSVSYPQPSTGHTVVNHNLFIGDRIPPAGVHSLAASEDTSVSSPMLNAAVESPLSSVENRTSSTAAGGSSSTRFLGQAITESESSDFRKSPKSISSDISLILDAKKRAIDSEYNYILSARHAAYISDQIRERKIRENDDSSPPGDTAVHGIPISVHIENKMTAWLNNHQPDLPFFQSGIALSQQDAHDNGKVSVERHEPLTTPAGSLQSNERNLRTKNEDNQSDFSMKTLSRADSGGKQDCLLKKRTKFVEFLADLMQCGVKEVISYCNMIPEFSDLVRTDQEQLLRNTILELLILKCFFDYRDGGFVNGANGIWLHREDFIFATSQVSFIDNMMQLMSKMEQLGMAEEETLLLMLVTLFSDDRPNSFISEREKILKAKRHFVQIMLRNMANMENRGTECLLLLPQLRSLNNSFLEVLTTISENKKVDLGTISCLIYELKPEADSTTRFHPESNLPFWPYTNVHATS